MSIIAHWRQKKNHLKSHLLEWCLALCLLCQILMEQLYNLRTSKTMAIFEKSLLYTSTFSYLAENCSPPNHPETYCYKSADLNHNSTCLASRGPSSGVPPVSVSLVNNRKGSLLPPALPTALRQVGTGIPIVPPRRRPAASVAAGEVSRIQGVRSLPVKYRYHSGHPSYAMFSLQHSKPPAAPTVCALVAIRLSNKKHVPAGPQHLHV